MLQTKSKKLRILHIIGSGTIGGAEHFVYQLARYQKLECKEADAMIYFVRETGYFYEQARKDKLSLSFPPSFSKLGGYWYLFFRMREFDLLHFHGVYPFFFALAIISRRRCLYYFHGARALTKSPKVVLQNMLRKKTARSLPTLKGLGRMFKKLWFQFFLTRFVCKAHCPSQYYVEFCIRTYGISSKKLSRLPIGLDYSKQVPSTPALTIRSQLGLADEIVIGCISTFRKLKRIDRLLTAFSRYLDMDKRPNTKLVIVGDGEHRKEIEGLIDHLHLKSWVILAGYRTDTANLLQIMDVFVLPSESESFSIAIAEAMFARIPVIGFAGSGGAEELLKQSSAGIIVENESELADQLFKLTECERKRKKIGGELHKYALSHLSMSSFNDSLMNDYINCHANKAEDLIE